MSALEAGGSEVLAATGSCSSRLISKGASSILLALCNLKNQLLPMYLNPYVNPVVNLFIKAAETDLPEAARSTRELLQLSLESLKAPTCPFGRDLRQKLAEGTVNSSMTKMAVGCPAFGSPAFAGFMNWAKQARDL